MSAERDDIERKLLAVARRVIAPSACIANLERLSAGANKETWSFDAVCSGQTVGLVLRRAPGGTFPQRAYEAGLENEAVLIQLAAHTGVPVPHVRHVLTPEDGLGRGFISDRIPGETLARKILRDDQYAALRPRLAHMCGTIAARIHSMELVRVPDLRRATPASEVELLAGLYREIDSPHAVFELALRYLRDRAPAPPPKLALVHGDFRLGNFIIGPDGMQAVLDWELAHIGDPMEDLAWICVNSWRFGNIDKPVGGFGTREDLFAGYEEACGMAVDPERVRFWEILGSLRWGISCAGMVATFRSGLDSSVERAMIARRVSETEIDILRLIAPKTPR